MERPLKDVRLIGPFAQDLNPSSEALAANEIRILLGRLVESAESNVSVLESARDGELPERSVDDAISMTRFNRRTLDSAAEKLAAQHKEMSGTLPSGWREYKDAAEKRDELLDEVA